MARPIKIGFDNNLAMTLTVFLVPSVSSLNMAACLVAHGPSALKMAGMAGVVTPGRVELLHRWNSQEDASLRRIRSVAPHCPPCGRS